MTGRRGRRARGTGIGWRLAVALLAGVSGMVVAAGPSGAQSSSGDHAVGVVSETFVDHSRQTPAHGGHPALPFRALATTVWYTRPRAHPVGRPSKARHPTPHTARTR